MAWDTQSLQSRAAAGRLGQKHVGNPFGCALGQNGPFVAGDAVLEPT